MSADDGAGTREIAQRLFAAEYDDATLSYSESDEERAPNYVVTPTGARVNRLFVVGVLTATESVNEDMLRARIVDPTGAFVAYAGQYQPDALAFFERATPPAFVALTAKARTFQPEDSDRVFTSARPETVNEVDGDTRDRWIVSAAKTTLRRVSLFDAALSSGLRGDELERHLREHGVEEALATGIPRAIDHYGTTTAYLDAVRQLALDALAVVAGEREDVRELSLAPDEGGAAALGAIPADLRADEAIAAPEATAGSAPSTAADAGDESVSDAVDTSVSEAGVGSVAATATDSATDATGSPTSESVTDSGSDAADVATAATDSTDSDAEPTAPVETSEDTSTGADASTPDASPAAGTESDEAAESDATASDDLGDFDDSLSGETDTDDVADDANDAVDDTDDVVDAADSGADEAAPSDESELDGTASADAPTDATDVNVAEDDLYEFDEEEREAVRQEHGLSFESGADVDSPGEAGIETPDPEGSDAEPTVEETGNATADETTAATDDATSDDDSADVAESDLTDTVVDVMDELDEGDGADREEVIATVVQRYGSDPGAVEDAIQEALMDGQCYEPGEGRLKAI